MPAERGLEDEVHALVGGRDHLALVSSFLSRRSADGDDRGGLNFDLSVGRVQGLLIGVDVCGDRVEFGGRTRDVVVTLTLLVLLLEAGLRLAQTVLGDFRGHDVQADAPVRVEGEGIDE